MNRTRTFVLLLALSLLGAPIISSVAFAPVRTPIDDTRGNSASANDLEAAVLYSKSATPVGLLEI